MPRLVFAVLAAYSLVLFCPPSRALAEPLSELIGGDTQLLVDDARISRREGLVRVLGRPAKTNGGRPVSVTIVDPAGIRRPMPVWQLFHTVLWDDSRERFRMWCRGLPERDAVQADGSADWTRVRYVYCESGDGVNFEFVDELRGLYSRGDYNLVVTLDEEESDPRQRYRIGYDGAREEFPNGACLAHSADGIHWTPYNAGRPVTGRAADFSNQVFRDRAAGLFRMFTRTDFGAAGGVDERRGVRMMTNPDLNADPAGWTTLAQWQFDREGPLEWKRRQPYMLTDWRHHGIHFALMSVYEWPTDYSEGLETDHFRRHERDINNFYLMTSRDALDWDQSWVYQQRPFIPRGGDGCWDKDLLFPSSEIITRGDWHWIYYGGCNERHGTPGICLPRRDPGIGLALLRRDRLIGLRAGPGPGRMLTTPFRLDGDKLEFNVEALEGEFRVAVRTARGEPIAGFALEDSHAYRGHDELELRPQWRNGADLGSLRGQRVALELQFSNATVYSWRVVPAACD